MALILFVGTDLTVLEGLAQTLAAAGERVRLTTSLYDIDLVEVTDPPLVAVVERGLAYEATRTGTGIPSLTLAHGGTLVLYHGIDDGPLTLPGALTRMVLADLTLPLERQRLVALVQTVAARERDRAAGTLTPRPEMWRR